MTVILVHSGLKSEMYPETTLFKYVIKDITGRSKGLTRAESIKVSDSPVYLRNYTVNRKCFSAPWQYSFLAKKTHVTTQE